MNQSTKEEWRIKLIIAMMIVVLLIGFWLGYNFIKMNKQGLSCIRNPMTWAQEFRKSQDGLDYECYCGIAERSSIIPFGPNLNISQNWT